jgi:hypothetical protein
MTNAFANLDGSEMLAIRKDCVTHLIALVMVNVWVMPRLDSHSANAILDLAGKNALPRLATRIAIIVVNAWTVNVNVPKVGKGMTARKVA